MPYLALDDNFPDNPKIAGLSDRAFRLHIVALCYCSSNLTDGFVPKSAKNPRKIGSTDKLSGQLVKAGLWEIVEGGYMIHDYLEWNASAAQIKEKRARDRQRKRSRSFNDSARNPDGNEGNSTRIPRVAPLEELSKESSSSGEPAKSVRQRRANPNQPTQPAPPSAAVDEPELPPPDERQRIAAELRAQVLGDQAAQRHAHAVAAAARSNNGNDADLPPELRTLPDEPS